MSKQYYYDIPPVPVQRHSMINHDQQGHAPRRVVVDTDDDDMIELKQYPPRDPFASSDYYTSPRTAPVPPRHAYNQTDFNTMSTAPAYTKPLIHEEVPQPNKTTLMGKIFKQPWFTYIVTVVDLVYFIVELVRMAQLTGSAFQTKPYFNPMLGPSSYVQIYLGSRFTPCALPADYIDLNYAWPCPNSTSTSTDVCSLAELCGFTDDGEAHAQIWRIFSACFMHAGFVHILFNLLLQLTMGREVEMEIGTLRYAVIYLISGISGNLFGLNFAGDGVSSTGASGALFGIIAVNLILFLLHKDRRRIRGYKFLVGVLFGEILVCLVLGLLPGLDNFAHIGGFVSGLLLSFVLLDNPRFVKEKPDRKFPLTRSHENYKMKHFYIWSTLRVVSLGLLIGWFVALGLNIKNGGGNCSWCKYLSCLPVNDWCEQSELSTSSS